MCKVCRNFGPCCACKRPFGRHGALLIDLLPQPGFGQLLNVMHHAVQAPPRVDLLAPPVIQTDQALVVTDVGKHRLDRSKALAVELFALG